MRTTKKLCLFLLLATMPLISVSTLADNLRLGHIVPPPHIWHKVAKRFADNLQATTGGQDSVTIFPLGKLGGDVQLIDLLQSGAVQFAIVTAGSLSNRYEPMNAWFLPYEFEDVADAAAATQSPVAQRMLADLQPHKLVGLGYTLAGMRHVISSRPFTSLDDFSNKKIRAFPNRVFNDWWRDLHASPTNLALSDVSSALTTNLLDAVDVDLDIVVGLKMYQQAPYLTLTNHMAFPGVMVASATWWQGLTEDRQKQVMDAFKEAEAWGFEQQALAEVKNLQLLKDAGVTVSQIPKSEFKPVADEIVAQYTGENPVIAEFYQQFHQ